MKVNHMIVDPSKLMQLDETQLQHLPIYYFSKNTSGEYIGCNDFMAQALGFTRGAEVLGKNDFDLVWTESAPLLRGNDNEVMKTEQSKTYCETGRLADGNLGSAMSYKWPLRLQSKKIAGIICISIPFAKEILQHNHWLDVIAQQYDITKRQQDCLHYLVKGMTIKEIAHVLGLSPRTVEHYIEALKVKLNCNSRSQLIAKVSVS